MTLKAFFNDAQVTLQLDPSRVRHGGLGDIALTGPSRGCSSLQQLTPHLLESSLHLGIKDPLCVKVDPSKSCHPPFCSHSCDEAGTGYTCIICNRIYNVFLRLYNSFVRELSIRKNYPSARDLDALRIIYDLYMHKRLLKSVPGSAPRQPYYTAVQRTHENQCPSVAPVMYTYKMDMRKTDTRKVLHRKH